MAKRLDAATLQTIHDLEEEVDHLKTQAVSLRASFEAQGGELRREHETNARLVRERDYFKAFSLEIATRLIVVREAIDAVLQSAELAGYKPLPVASFKDATTEQVDAVVAELGKKLAPMSVSVTPEKV